MLVLIGSLLDNPRLILAKTHALGTDLGPLVGSFGRLKLSEASIQRERNCCKQTCLKTEDLEAICKIIEPHLQDRGSSFVMWAGNVVWIHTSCNNQTVRVQGV